MSGLGGAATVIGTVGTPRRSAMLMSQPSMYMPMRSSDADTSWPSPVRSRAKQRGGHGAGGGEPGHVVAHAAALVRAAAVPSGVSAAATPARDQNAPTS